MPNLGQCIGEGLECQVYSYGCGKVIKVYPTFSKAENALNRQRLAFENDLAPAVFSETPISIYSYYGGYDGYGIIVEKVELLNEKDYEIDEYGELIPIQDFYCDYEELKENLFELFETDVYDLHIHNLGFRKDGRLVCIDFGNDSWEG